MNGFNKTQLLIRLISLYIILVFSSTCNPERTSDASRQESPQPAPVATGDLSGITIGMSVKTLNAPYFVAQLNAVKRFVEERGMKFIYNDAQDDIVRQIAFVEDLLVQGIDLLILNPLDPKALVPATKSATRAGVPVLIIDSSIDPSADFVTTVQANNQRNGELVGEWLVRKLNGRKIRCVMMSGAQGNPVGRERRQGLIRGITEQQLRSYGQADLEILAQGWGNWTYIGGLTAMEDMLVAHPDINLLVSEQDAMALGALQAIEEAGRKDDIFVVAAADGQKEAYELIMKGEYGATGLNDPVLIAEMVVDIAVRYLSGERDFPDVIHTPAACIHKDNVEEHYDPDAIF